MMQRAREVYLSLEDADRQAADAWLDRIGGQRFRDFQDPPRLARSELSVALAA
jgi:hypothetical protein